MQKRSSLSRPVARTGELYLFVGVIGFVADRDLAPVIFFLLGIEVGHKPGKARARHVGRKFQAIPFVYLHAGRYRPDFERGLAGARVALRVCRTRSS